MILNVTVDDQTFGIEVPQEVLDEGEDFFSRMDRDMDHGWQMSREFVENPTTENRCQIAADKIVSAMHANNNQLIVLMAGYILSRMPDTTNVLVDTSGDMLNTRLIRGDGQGI